MRSLLKTVSKMLHSHYMELFCGIVLTIAGAWEMWDTWKESKNNFQGHHGVFIYGIVLTLKNLVHILEGLTTIEENLEEIEKE